MNNYPTVESHANMGLFHEMLLTHFINNQVSSQARKELLELQENPYDKNLACHLYSTGIYLYALGSKISDSDFKNLSYELSDEYPNIISLIILDIWG